MLMTTESHLPLKLCDYLKKKELDFNITTLISQNYEVEEISNPQKNQFY